MGSVALVGEEVKVVVDGGSGKGSFGSEGGRNYKGRVQCSSLLSPQLLTWWQSWPARRHCFLLIALLLWSLLLGQFLPFLLQLLLFLLQFFHLLLDLLLSVTGSRLNSDGV